MSKTIYIKKELSNGQKAVVAICQDNSSTLSLGFGISSSYRSVIRWYEGLSGKLDNKSTGEVGLEGLLFALRTIKQIQKNLLVLNKQCYLVISYDDKKRESTYRRLLKEGFVPGIYQDEAVYYWSNK